MGIDTGVHTERQGQQCRYRRRCTHIERDTSMGINTVVHTDGDSSADIDTGVHTNRQEKQCGNRHR